MAQNDKVIKALDKISEWSLYILIFTLPYAKSIIEITIVTALVSLAIKKLITKERLFGRSSLDILLYLFVLASLASLVNTSYFALSARAFFSKTLKFALLFLITKDILNTKDKVDNFSIMALISAVVVAIDAFLQLFISIDVLHLYPIFQFKALGPSFKGFPTACFPFPNDFSAWILVYIFPLGLYAFLRGGGWRVRMVCGVAFISLIYMLMLAKVRGAWLGFLTAFSLLSFLRIRKSIIVVTLAVLIVTGLLVNRSLVSHLWNKVSLADRGVMWENGIEIFKKHPIIGNGVNTFHVMYAEVRKDIYKHSKGSYAHNCYLQIAAETGVVGLVTFLAFAFTLIVKGFKSLKAIEDPSLHKLVMGINLGIIAFLVHSAGDTNLYSLNLAALFWVSAGVMIAAINAATVRR